MTTEYQRSYWAKARFTPYLASAHRGASLHIVSGPSADDGGDAPLQQRDVFVANTKQKGRRLACRTRSLYIVRPFLKRSSHAASGVQEVLGDVLLDI